MARKAKYDWGKSSGKYQKFETRLTLKWDGADADSSPYSDSVYIDVAQCLSVVNRKLVRQGQVFKIKNMRVYTNDDDVVCMLKVGALPRTWPMFNAYKKARGLWNGLNLEVYSDVGVGNLPAYYDFKVYMDDNHVQNVHNSGDPNLLPVDFEDSVAAIGEWVYSQFADSGSSSDEHYVHMFGGHVGSDDWVVEADDYVSSGDAGFVGVIFVYQQSRGLSHLFIDAMGLDQQSVIVLTYGSWGMLRGDGDSQAIATIANMDADNDDPPYSATIMPGTRANLPGPTTIFYGRLAELSYHGTSLATAIPQFEAPLGLIRLEVDAESDTGPVPGIHVHFDTEIMGTIQPVIRMDDKAEQMLVDPKHPIWKIILLCVLVLAGSVGLIGPSALLGVI